MTLSVLVSTNIYGKIRADSHTEEVACSENICEIIRIETRPINVSCRAEIIRFVEFTINQSNLEILDNESSESYKIWINVNPSSIWIISDSTMQFRVQKTLNRIARELKLMNDYFTGDIKSKILALLGERVGATNQCSGEIDHCGNCIKNMIPVFDYIKDIKDEKQMLIVKNHYILNHQNWGVNKHAAHRDRVKMERNLLEMVGFKIGDSIRDNWTMTNRFVADDRTMAMIKSIMQDYKPRFTNEKKYPQLKTMRMLIYNYYFELRLK